MSAQGSHIPLIKQAKSSQFTWCNEVEKVLKPMQKPVNQIKEHEHEINESN